MENIQQTLSKHIKELRLKHNLSQAEFGKKIGVTVKTVKAWEARLRIPRFNHLIKLAVSFDIRLNNLCGFDL